MFKIVMKLFVVVLTYTDPTRSVVLIGGSHAGVIIGRLIGEYPDEYAVAVLRNPVTDLLHLYSYIGYT